MPEKLSEKVIDRRRQRPSVAAVADLYRRSPRARRCRYPARQALLGRRARAPPAQGHLARDRRPRVRSIRPVRDRGHSPLPPRHTLSGQRRAHRHQPVLGARIQPIGHAAAEAIRAARPERPGPKTTYAPAAPSALRSSASTSPPASFSPAPAPWLQASTGLYTWEDHRQAGSESHESWRARPCLGGGLA